MKLSRKIALLFSIMTLRSAFGDSMTVSQQVIFEGFKGAVFSYVPPTKEQINAKCGDGNVTSLQSSFPKYLPPRNPVGNPKDKFSMSFNYDIDSPFGSDAKCAVPLTTVIVWKNQTGTHSCYFTVALGGGGENAGLVKSTGKKHLCMIGKDDGTGKVTGNECYSNDCNSSNDSSKSLWVVHAKN